MKIHSINKSTRYFLALAIALFVALNFSTLLAQNKAAYMIPDIGAPGMNVYVEIIAHVDSLGAFGSDELSYNNASDKFRLQAVSLQDREKIIFGPLVISWDGRLISSQAFINPSLKPTSWKWDEGIRIPIGLYEDNTLINSFDFYVVNPFHLGDISKQTSPTEKWGSEDVIKLGKEPFGMRSPRGAMLVDSLIMADNMRYVVSTEDCDINMPGNQGYLPFTLLSLGDVRGGENTTISVDGLMQFGGAGGGGGGGAFCDKGLGDDLSESSQKGGDGFTGGGIGGVNGSNVIPNYYSNLGGGIGSGSDDNSSLLSYAGYSLNGVKGADKAGYEASGGGTGHPFGRSGHGSWNDDRQGEYGGGSGKKQRDRGGIGAYSTRGNASAINDGNIHGNRMLMPLAGGSGGGSGNPKIVIQTGCAGYGGGAGGGIAIFSYLNNKDYNVSARGADGANYTNNAGGVGGSGSGGGVLITSKLNTNIGVIDVNGGNFGNDSAGAGYIRIDALELPKAAPSREHFVGLAIDTSSHVGKTKKINLTGYGKCELIIRNERSEWRNITTTYEDNWMYEITDDVFKYEGDTLFYVVALQPTPNRKSVDPYENEPFYIMSQAAANILKVERTPYIVKNQDLELKKTTINCPGAEVKFDVQKVINIGDADLIFWKDKFSSLLPWGKISITGDEISTDNNGNYIVKAQLDKTQDTIFATITISYTIPPNLASGTYYDTLKLWHNDSLRVNPWVIPVELEIQNIETKNLDEVSKEISEIDLGEFCVNSTPDSSVSFFVKNVSETTITLNDFLVEDNSIDVEIVGDKILVPEDSVQVVVKLKAANKEAGKYTTNIIKKYLECESYADTIKVIYTLIETELEFTKQELIFDKVRIGSDSLANVSLINKSNYNIILREEFISLYEGVNYKIHSVTPSLPAVLKPDDKVEITIKFAPKEEGELLDTLLVRVPFTANTCEGEAALPIRGTGATFSLYAEDIDFGITDCKTIIDSVWVVNRKSASSQNVHLITPARIEEDIAGTFKILEEPKATTILAPGDSVLYVISAEVTEQNTGKVINGTLFVHNDSLKINLTFEVDSKEIEVLETPVDFGSIALGSEATRTVTVKNLGKLDKNVIDIKFTNKQVDYVFNPKTFVVPAKGESVFEVKATPKLDSEASSFLDTFELITDCYKYQYTLEGEIISAKIENKLVDFDTSSVCDEITKTAVLKNIGQTQIEVLEVVGIDGKDRALFELTAYETLKKVLNEDEEFTAEITFRPKGATGGEKNAKLVLKILADGKEQYVSIPLKGFVKLGLLATPSLKDFGNIFVGNQKIDKVVLDNIGDYPLKINNIFIQKATDFSIASNISDIVLQVGDDFEVSIIFTGLTLGEKNDTLLVDFVYDENCRDTMEIPLRGNVVPSNEITISVTQHNEVNPRTKDYRIPVLIKTSPNPLENFVIKEITLEHNRKLFYPKSVTNGEMEIGTAPTSREKRRTIIKNIEVKNLSPDTETVLFEIIGDVLLGDKDSTEIEIIDDVVFEDNLAVSNVKKNNGYLTISICQDRLLYYANSVSTTIFYNPLINSTLEAEVSTVELGKHSLEIANYLGQKVTLKEWEVTQEDNKSFVFKAYLESYPTGNYMLILNTPTAIHTQSFILLK